MVSPKIQSADSQASNKNKCSSSLSTTSKQHTLIDDETVAKIKIEDGADEIKIFSASTILKNEPDDDNADIEDRLSPVVEEPVRLN